jgi:formylglycine-generating enzyme required for sulfatase activity/serine/threonine protein kinase
MLSIDEILHGRYRIKRRIGYGGMGAVYEAEDSTRFGKIVALKEILIDLTEALTPERQKALKNAFEHEAKILTKLDHEAFPQVIDYFTEKDGQYLVMELVNGEDLHKRLGKTQNILTQKEILNFAEQLLDALIYLHTLNPPIIHRDIKPQNLRITSRGRIKLLDFGIAKGFDTQVNKTIDNQQTFLAASREYSPFEQLLRVLDKHFLHTLMSMHDEKIKKTLKQSADATTDIYALGATLYHLFTNSAPVTAVSRTLEIWRGNADPLPSPCQINPSISPEISAWLLKAMAVERENRFATALEMQETLHKAILSEKLREEAAERQKRLEEQEKLKKEWEEIYKARENFEQSRRDHQKQIEERKRQDELEKESLQKLKERADKDDKRILEQEKQKVAGIESAVTDPFTIQPPIDGNPVTDNSYAAPVSNTFETTGLTGDSYFEAGDFNSSEHQEELPAESSNIAGKPKTIRTNQIFWITSGVAALVLCLGVLAGLIILKRGSYFALTNSNTGKVNLTKSPQDIIKDNTARESPDTIPVPPNGMAYIPGGDFIMGRDDGKEVSEKPAHKVTVEPFFMDVYETTNEEYAEFVKATGRKPPQNWKGGNYPDGQAKFPVVGVNWEDAAAYADWAGKRLPTEEEWEFAARGTNGFLYPWGNDWNQDNANVDNVSETFAEVGEFKGVSPFGLHDMVGNAWEWTMSDFKAYPNGKLPDDFSGGKNSKTIRGGSFNTPKDYATTTYRWGWAVTGAREYKITGFRCAKDLVR